MVGKYFLINAAVAGEAYDSNVQQNAKLHHKWWQGYDPRTWSANWYQLEGQDATRQKLTWRNRFSTVLTRTTAYNFYSGGDEAFELTTDPNQFTGLFVSQWHFIVIPEVWFVRYCWQKQEMLKGTAYSHLLPFGTTDYAGWGFNSTLVYDSQNNRYDVVPVYTPGQANSASAASLRTTPVFYPNPSWMFGSTALTDPQVNELLAKGIPALTPSVGRYGDLALFQSEQKLDMNSDNCKVNGWPRKFVDDEYRWLHNDIREVAYLYTYEAFDRIAGDGGLK